MRLFGKKKPVEPLYSEEFQPVDPADEQAALDRVPPETYPDSDIPLPDTILVGETTMPSGQKVPVILPRSSAGPSDTPPSPANK